MREDFMARIGGALVDALEDAVGDDAHALLVHRLGQGVAHVLVEAAQHLVAAIDQRHLAAQTMEDVGELDRDITAADDDDAVGQMRRDEGLVGGDGMLGADAIAHVARRPPAGGDEDVAGGDRAVRLLQMDRVRVHEFGPLHDDLDAGLGDVLVIEPFEARDLLVLVGDQHVPVEFRPRHRPAEAAGILEILDIVAGIDEQLLGDAAADHAGAAEAVFLGDGDLGAVAGRQPAGAHAARAAADDEEIVVVSAVMRLSVSDTSTPSARAMTSVVAMPMKRP